MPPGITEAAVFDDQSGDRLLGSDCGERKDCQATREQEQKAVHQSLRAEGIPLVHSRGTMTPVKRFRAGVHRIMRRLLKGILESGDVGSDTTGLENRTSVEQFKPMVKGQ